jgi:hypothetical protein
LFVVAILRDLIVGRDALKEKEGLDIRFRC